MNENQISQLPPQLQPLLREASKRVVIHLPRNTAGLATPEGIERDLRQFKQTLGSVTSLLAKSDNDDLLRQKETFQELGEQFPEEFIAITAAPASSLQDITELIQGTSEIIESLPVGDDNLKDLRTVLGDARRQWKALVEATKPFEHFVRSVTITVAGDIGDVLALVEKVAGQAAATGQNVQEQLAAQYTYTGGKTTCCERQGFNPPDGIATPPAHLAEVSVDEESLPERVRMLLSLLSMRRSNGAPIGVVLTTSSGDETAKEPTAEPDGNPTAETAAQTT